MALTEIAEVSPDRVDILSASDGRSTWDEWSVTVHHRAVHPVVPVFPVSVHVWPHAGQHSFAPVARTVARRVGIHPRAAGCQYLFGIAPHPRTHHRSVGHLLIHPAGHVLTPCCWCRPRTSAAVHPCRAGLVD